MYSRRGGKLWFVRPPAVSASWDQIWASPWSLLELVAPRLLRIFSGQTE
jgi:hypothetical protein